MKKMRHNLFLVCLLVLCTTICYAETITTVHNFHAMSGDNTQIQYSNNNTIAETPLLTYKCTKASFGLYTEVVPHSICILMNESEATVTTTQVGNLKKLIINYYYEGSEAYDADEITISISADRQDWNTPDEIIYNKGAVDVVLPTGDYYLQIKRKSKKFYINQITYYTEKCACFPYIKPE